MATDQFKEILQIAVETLGEDQARQLELALRGIGNAGAEVDEQLSPLLDQFQKLSDEASRVGAALDLEQKLRANEDALAAAKESLASLSSEFDRTDKSSAAISISFEQAEKQIKSLATEQLKLQNASAAATAALKASGVDTSKLALLNNELKTKIAGVAQQIVSTANAAKQAGAGVGSLGDQSKRTGGILAELKAHLVEIVSFATAAGVAFKAIELGKDAFAGATNIEQSLARVSALAQSSVESFAALSDQIERSAEAANVSGTDAASAAASLAEQGQTATEIYQTLTPTLLLAKDASIDLAQAAGVVDDVLDLFGKSAGDASLAVDQLVAASKGSKDGVAGLADAIRTLAPDARQLGLTFEQLAGLLGFLGQNGVDAGKSVRALRTIFQDLQDPTSKFSTSLAQLGDSSGSFTKAIETLRASGQHGEDALLGLDGAARSLVLFLLQQGPGAIDAFTASLADAQGTAAATAKTLNDTLKGAFASFSNALDRVGSGLVKSSLTPLRDELRKLAEQLASFAESPAFAELQGALGNLFAEGTQAFDNFIQHVDWAKFVGDARSALTDASTSIRDFKDDLGTVASALGVIGDAVGVVYRSIAVVFDLAKVATSELVAKISESQLEYTRVLDALTGKTSTATMALESLRDSAKEASTKGVDALRENSDKLVANLESLGGAGDEAARKIDQVRVSFENVQSGVASSSAAIGRAGGDFNALTSGTENAANALSILPEIFNSDAVAAKRAADSHAEHADQIIRARRAVSDAQAALDRLAQSGDKNTVAFQQAAKAVQDAQEELDRLTGKAEQAADSQRALESAFSTLGIQSQKSLADAAENAKKALDVINAEFQKGNASIEDQTRAFEAWVDKVRAATADSSDAVKEQAAAMVEAEAHALGYGDAILKAGAAGKDAGDKTTAAFDSASDSIEGASAAAEDLAAHADAAAQSVQDVDAAANDSTSSLANATQGIVLLSNEQLRGLRSIRDELFAGGLSLEQYEQRIQEVMTGTSEALEQQAAQLRRLKDTEQDLLSAIAQENGDAIGVEDARHEQALRNLKDEATLNGQLNTIEYGKLKKLEDDLHELKLKNIREQAAAQKQAADSAQVDTDGASTGTAGGERASGPQKQTLDVNLNGTNLKGVNFDDPDLQKKIASIVIDQLKRAAKVSGRFATG
jgi:TP901 family phage tail tape measure protein